MRQCESMTAETYQLQPGGVRVVPQVVPEIKALHKFKDESKGVCWGGVNRNERDEIFVTFVEATAHQCFPIHPL